MATVSVVSLLDRSVVLRVDALVTVTDTPGPDISDPKLQITRKVAIPTATFTVNPGANAVDAAAWTAWKAQHDGTFAGFLIGP